MRCRFCINSHDVNHMKTYDFYKNEGPPITITGVQVDCMKTFE